MNAAFIFAQYCIVEALGNLHKASYYIDAVCILGVQAMKVAQLLWAVRIETKCFGTTDGF